MGVKITGIDKLQKQLKEVEKATEALNGSYDVRFDASRRSELITPRRGCYLVGKPSHL